MRYEAFFKNHEMDMYKYIFFFLTSFGWYGKQKGDGVATIPPYEQHIKTLAIIFHYIESHT